MVEHHYWTRAGLSRRTVLRGGALGTSGLAAAALIGCGTAKDTNPAARATQNQSGVAAGGAPAPKSGGRLAWEIDGDPPSLDLHNDTSNRANRTAGLAYNQLIQFDPKVVNEAPTALIPDLATQWEVSPDGMTYSFKLVDNAKFHDGTPMTSEDVLASYTRIQKPPKGQLGPRSSQLVPVKSFETPDKTSFVVKMSRAVSPLSFLPVTAQGWSAIMSKKDIDANFDYKTKVNGTGPYRMTAYEKGNRLSFDRNKDYFVKGRPYLDGVDTFIVPDASTALANAQSGRLHMNLRLDGTDLAVMQKAMGDKASYQSASAYNFVVVHWNGQRAPWNDERVRRAVTLGVNRTDGIKVVAKGDGDLGGCMMPGGGWALSQAELDAIPGYQPYSDATLAEAKKLMAAAGVQDGLKLSILIRTGSGEPPALFISDQLTKLGIAAKVDGVEAATERDRTAQFSFDLYVKSGQSNALDDPDSIFGESYLSNSPRNYARLKNAAVDDLYLKQSTELDPKKRLELVKEMQKAALAGYPSLIVFWNRYNAVVSKTVMDYKLHVSASNNTRMQDVWLNS